MNEELREAVAHFLYCDGNPFPDRWSQHDEATREEWRADADLLLALPEVAALLADAERVRRVEELVQGGEAQEAQTAAEGDPLTVMVRVSTLRHALDGDPS